jgi:hypothetical protein
MDAADAPLAADWWAVDGGICAIGTTRAKRHRSRHIAPSTLIILSP